MNWRVEFHPAFELEFDAYPEAVQDAILARAGLLEIHGPQLGRPYADTLNASRYANMKELRCDATGRVWRVAFAFDPERTAVLLIAGDKARVNQTRFYRQLLRVADARFAAHLARQKGER